MTFSHIETRSCPAVVRYDLAADGRHGGPAVIFARKAVPAGGRDDATDLVIVSGPLGQHGALATAVQLSERHAGPALRIAVCEPERDDDTRSGMASPVLLAAFDAVFVVRRADSAQFVRRLVRALTIPDDTPNWIGCAWGDVRHAVKPACGARLARHGHGTAGRAGAACTAAMAHMERQGACLRDAGSVCVSVTTAGPALPGKEALDVVILLRAAMHPAATIIQSLGCDAALPPGTLDVSVFAFGGNVTGVPVSTHHQENA
jgi:hypothetical protein